MGKETIWDPTPPLVGVVRTREVQVTASREGLFQPGMLRRSHTRWVANWKASKCRPTSSAMG